MEGSRETAAARARCHRRWPVVSIPLPETQIGEPRLVSTIDMTRASIAQNELGLSGDDIRVAVMDTGVDYDHASLGGAGTDNDTNSDDASLNGFPNSPVRGRLGLRR
jgi:subtilisin family serine protease